MGYSQILGDRKLPVRNFITIWMYVCVLNHKLAF